MEIDKHKYNRHSIRLKGFDYTTPWWYYITICTHGRQCLFGKVFRDKVILSEVGGIAKQCWEAIPEHFPNTELDEFIIMPNHLHGIVIIKDVGAEVGAQYIEPLQNNIEPIQNNIVPIQNNIEPLQNNTVPPQKIITPLQKKIEHIPNERRFQNIVPGSLSSIMRSYKAAVTRICREKGFEFKWHRNFYEHIIRNQKELDNIRYYIYYNASKWFGDENYSPE